MCVCVCFSERTFSSAAGRVVELLYNKISRKQPLAYKVVTAASTTVVVPLHKFRFAPGKHFRKLTGFIKENRIHIMYKTASLLLWMPSSSLHVILFCTANKDNKDLLAKFGLLISCECICVRARHGLKISSPARKRFGPARYTPEKYRPGPVTEIPARFCFRPTADTNQNTILQSAC